MQNLTLKFNPKEHASGPARGETNRSPVRTSPSYSGNNASANSTTQAMFNKYDIDGSGAISTKEFRKLCYDLGYYLSDLELEMDLKLLDANGDGEISYSEFIKWWKNDKRFEMLQMPPQEFVTVQQSSSYFQKFDKDNSGSIDAREFKELYNDLAKHNLTTKSVTATLREIDSSKDGKISFNEYIAWLLQGKGAAK
ncbi:uncharacterized protein BJ171DRAFT_600816 [Polychytrium aggregatum]|uniref:uncharacterized protein n=1 Tax=Polychytrium aggregatum TaxID=110093 RepID=UPI0022FF400A|nr:uncharacterized protein BJ171DRAFT_600816 [Polychytrium aggregatum]KAI9202551.1 hypothetical protein BJ171DRAFT_600816 [Polychytrium aggregatum]